MNRIKILTIAAVIAFIISGFLGEGSSPASTLDTLLTFGFLGYIWYAMRRAIGSQSQEKKPKQPPTQEQEQSAQPPEMREAKKAPRERRPKGDPQIIHHKSPWSVVETGDTVGNFRNAPIPAWIRTSDNRQADYSGITNDVPPEESVCLEIPERKELILPPGLIYAIRPS